MKIKLQIIGGIDIETLNQKRLTKTMACKTRNEE